MPADSKTEKATPRKRREERKEGNVLQSSDVASVSFILISFFSLQLLSPYMISSIEVFLKNYISLIGESKVITSTDIKTYSINFIITAASILVPIMLICMSVGIISRGIQTGFLFTTKTFKPKLSNLNPINGIKKMVALRNFVELIKNLIKVIILAYLVYTSLMDFMPTLIKTMDMDIKLSVAEVFSMVMDIIVKVCIVFTVIAVLDYFYQKWEYERKLRMSKHEVKEEYKQTEGNPQIKSKIRDLQRRRARTRMMQQVPSADVIIRNPTHFAVALKYDKDMHNSPVVIAKGQDSLAQRIIEVAQEHNVHVVENVPLARALYSLVELGNEIPEDYYSAVAEVLVYVYKLNKKLR